MRTRLKVLQTRLPGVKLPRKGTLPMAVNHPIRCWDVLITGFLQHPNQPNGFVAIWQGVRLHQDKDREVTFPMPWNSCWAELADTIRRCRDAAKETVVRIYAYSYGAGWGAVKFARELAARKIDVVWMVLSDPVHRSDWLVGRLSALFPFATIEIPDNVRFVSWFRQGMTCPRGHDLVADDPAVTTIYDPVYLAIPHTEMDDAPAFREECFRVAALPM